MLFVSRILRSPVLPKVLIPVFVVAALLAIASLSACDNDKKVTVPDPRDSYYLDQSSAANVLANLKTAYEKRNYPQYDKLFSTDYIFVFNPQDVVDPNNPTPQQWARADEMDSARHLFADSSVIGISLNWHPREVEADDTYGWKIRVDDVHLSVTTVNEQNEVWIHQVAGTTELFYFREEDVLTPNGKKKWVCTRWEDSPIGTARLGGDVLRPGVESTTWGQIKANYR